MNTNTVSNNKYVKEIDKAVLDFRFALQDVISLQRARDQKIDEFVIDSGSSPLTRSDPYMQHFSQEDRNVRRRTEATGYERRRAAKKLERSLDELQTSLNEYNIGAPLNDSIINDLMQVITLNSDEKNCVEDVLQRSNEAHHHASAEYASRICCQYGALPLTDSHVDSLLDHLATSFLSLNSRSFNDEFYAKIYPTISILNTSLRYSLLGMSLSMHENMKLLEILMQCILEDLGVKSPSINIPNSIPNQSILHVRVLVTYLLTHFHHRTLKRNEDDNEKDGSFNDDNCGNENVIANQFYLVFKEYLQETMEYAIASIELASSHLGSMCIPDEGYAETDNTQRPVTQQTRSRSRSTEETTCQVVQEAVFHVTIAANTAQIFCDAFSIGDRRQQDDDTFTTIFTTFSSFVAKYAPEVDRVGELHYNHHHHGVVSFTKPKLLPETHPLSIFRSAATDSLITLARLADLEYGSASAAEPRRIPKQNFDAYVTTLVLALQKGEMSAYEEDIAFLMDKCQQTTSEGAEGNDDSTTYRFNGVLQLMAASAYIQSFDVRRRWHGGNSLAPMSGDCPLPQPQAQHGGDDVPSLVEVNNSDEDELVISLMCSKMNELLCADDKFATKYDPWNALLSRKLSSLVDSSSQSPDSSRDTWCTAKESIAEYCRAIQLDSNAD